jgi:hypothetical protein
MKKSKSSQKPDYYQRFSDLKLLVNDNNFLNKNSKEYSAAMYLLIRILEEKRGSQIYNGAKLNQLRNGLVHGFFAVNPLEVQYFVNQEIDNLCNNFKLGHTVEEYKLFQQVKQYNPDSVKDSILQRQSLKYERSEISEVMRANIELSKKEEIENSHSIMAGCRGVLEFFNLQDEIRTSRGEIRTSRYAKLYQIACFSETVKQLRRIEDLGGELALAESWRNQIFHDTGTLKQGERTFDHEIGDDTILSWINKIRRYDPENKKIMTQQEFEQSEPRTKSGSPGRTEKYVPDSVTILNPPSIASTPDTVNSKDNVDHETLDILRDILGLDPESQITSNGKLRKYFSEIKVQKQERSCIKIQIKNDGTDFSQTVERCIKLAVCKKNGSYFVGIEEEIDQKLKDKIKSSSKELTENVTLLSIQTERGTKRKEPEEDAPPNPKRQKTDNNNLFQISDIEKALIKLASNLQGNKKTAMQSPIKTVYIEDFSDSEISSKDTLELALYQCQSMQPDQYKIIVFKVNAGSTNFAEQQNENNHYVGLVINKDQNNQYKITYIDPTGRPVHSNITEIIKDKLGNGNANNQVEVLSSKTQLQLYGENTQVGTIVDGTNCGPFLAYLINLSINGTQLESGNRKITNKKKSDELGLALRNYYKGETDQLPDLESYIDKHLRLSTKSNLKQITETPKPNLKQILQNHLQSLDRNDRTPEELKKVTLETITEFSKQKSIQDSNNIFLPDNQLSHESSSLTQQKSSTKSKIHLLAESNHQTDHPNHIRNLLYHINSLLAQSEGKTNNIIIVLERKQEGKNLGMPDVILLSELIKKEEELNQVRGEEISDQERPDNLSPISLIPDDIRNSLIYQDALLYKAAEEKGIKVIGIDKANIIAQKKPDRENYDPLAYNHEREDHMVEALSTISNNYPNYDIIFPVGESHTQNISNSLKEKSLDVVIDDSFNNLETVRETSVLAGILSIELEGTNNALEALQKQMQARQKKSEQQLQETEEVVVDKESPESFVERLEQEQPEESGNGRY